MERLAISWFLVPLVYANVCGHAVLFILSRQYLCFIVLFLLQKENCLLFLWGNMNEWPVINLHTSHDNDTLELSQFWYWITFCPLIRKSHNNKSKTFLLLGRNCTAACAAWYLCRSFSILVGYSNFQNPLISGPKCISDSRLLSPRCTWCTQLYT